MQGTADYGCDELQSDLYALAAEFPGALSVSEIGRSVDGRSILAAAAGAEGAEFEVIIQAGIHGREMCIRDRDARVLQESAYDADDVYVLRLAGDARQDAASVSYTHLDVYKRQGEARPR